MAGSRESGAGAASGAAAAASRAGGAVRVGTRRLIGSWSHLAPSQRLPAYACAAMVATMFLPWYSQTVAGRFGTGADTRIDAVTETVSAWGKFTFVEAGVLLVAAAVLLLLFRRGEGKAFHLPGGDGTVIAVGGGWAAFLCFYRLFDQPATERLPEGVVTYGVRWGLFFAMVACLFLASTGLRLRAADVAEPPLPGESGPPRPRAAPERPPAPAADDAHLENRGDADGAPTRVDPALQPTRVDPTAQPTRVAPRREGEGAEQLSFDEPE
jgi:hypothetical protein